MNFVIVNYCPCCGAPIWIDTQPLLLGMIPKTFFSCECNPQKNGAGYQGPYLTKEPPEKFDIEITCTGTGSRKILRG